MAWLKRIDLAAFIFWAVDSCSRQSTFLSTNDRPMSGQCAQSVLLDFEVAVRIRRCFGFFRQKIGLVDHHPPVAFRINDALIMNWIPLRRLWLLTGSDSSSFQNRRKR